LPGWVVGIKMDKEVIAEMGAGLGNQMNIYAAALRLSLEKKTPLYLDLTWFNTWPKYMVPREFGLDKFNISAKIATKKQIRKYIWRTKFRHINGIMRRLKLGNNKTYDEGKDFHNVIEFLNIEPSCYIRGYFNRDYFEDIKSRLIGEFKLKDKYKSGIRKLRKKLKEENSVAIHVRRGDLTKLKNGYVLPLSYYKKAISMINKEVKTPKFYIFSDDIGWCKKSFRWLNNKEFMGQGMVEQDFELMRICKDKILANSSLSWWAAYLGRRGIIIAPRYFKGFRPKNWKESKTKNILEDWRFIKNE
jgi:hypothetical protein